MAKDSGVVNIHGKEYLTVAKRVSDFRDEHKYAFGIETEVIEITEQKVVMKATIRNQENFIVATGHAEEDRRASTINKTSALENCETSAIGRALAAFGLAGTEFASADEVANAIKQQNTPAKKNGWNPSESKPVSDQQRISINNLLRQRGIETREAITEWMYDNYGGVPENEADAQAIIDDLDHPRKVANGQVKEDAA